ncbi:MAG: aminotransferase class I/II-fold pyridoxal phosphate-dependent enzyme [Victivallales bacterium]|nr:aminotransferase class I/II-fold pyridoxal phosphate-dependent enzyme [Victivallales bacterium]
MPAINMFNELAITLNDQIQAVNPVAYEMLSALGKRIYFPSKGILSQSGEAKTLAKKFNATIGTALKDHQAMSLPCVMDSLPGFSPNEALLYAPSYGQKPLREAWKAKILHDNPSLATVPFSLPVVTNGLTQALALAGDLLLDPGDHVLIPNMLWDNYLLNYSDRLQADLRHWEFFQGDRLNTMAFAQALEGYMPGQKVFVILNFPNNPTGYTPLESEAQALADTLLATAERGVRVVALIDDAYYGLFFDPACIKESLFCKVAGKSRNLLAIKADAATKECYVWGLRTGFLSFAIGGAEADSPLFTALEAKATGLVRATISNCSALSQKIITNALTSGKFYEQRAANVAIMHERCSAVMQTLTEHPEYREHFVAYPFNSGYFMCIKVLKTSTTKLRRLLLDKYATGGIAMSDTDFRLAFSCVEKEQIPELFKTIYQACKDLA